VKEPAGSSQVSGTDAARSALAAKAEKVGKEGSAK